MPAFRVAAGVLVIGLTVSSASCGGVGPTDSPEAPATLAVVTASDGSADDPDGYTIALDGGEPQPVGINDSLALGAIAVGAHELLLGEMARGCAPYGTNPRSVSAAAGQRVRVAFHVQCMQPPEPPTLVFQAPGLRPLVGPRDTVHLVLEVTPHSLDPFTGVTFTFTPPGPPDTVRLPVTGTDPFTIHVILVVPVLPLVGAVIATATVTTAQGTYSSQQDFMLGDADPPHFVPTHADTVFVGTVAIDGPGVALPYTAASRSGLTSVDVSTTGAFTLDTVFPVDSAPVSATRNLTIVMPANGQVGDTFDILVGGTNIYGHSARGLYLRYRMVRAGGPMLAGASAAAARTGSPLPVPAPGSLRWRVAAVATPTPTNGSSRRGYDAGCICEKNVSAAFRISSGVRSCVC